MQTRALRTRSPGWRFYLEVALGAVGLVLFGVTLVWNDWIELAFRVSPDEGNGSAEYLVCFGLLALAAGGWWLARTEWRRFRSGAAERKSWLG
jgi:hypothetical protein